MGKIEKILKKGPVEGQTTEVYPVTSTKAIYDENNKRLDNIITGLQESVYLNTPIPISSEDTPEANAQNVKNITDYVEKAKAAGIEDVNGMAVTCIINDAYSGVGYIMGNTDVVIQGIKITDDLVDNTVFIIYGGVYFERTVIAVGTPNKVDSDMLNKGARNPIIFTLETTEVDEETYQKLFPDGFPTDNVDIMFRIGGFDASEFIPCISSTIKDAEGYMELYFAGISCGRTLQSTFLIGYYVTIGTGAPHQCEVTQLQYKSLNDILSDAGYFNKSALNPVLKEIDLTGTDADRKAKLDQFAIKWKTLTGTSDLNGARFVGNVSINDEATTNVLLSRDMDDNYSGISMSDDVDVSQLKKIVVHPNNGSVESTPLFSHLEGITLKAGNTNTDMAVNVATIKAYINNLKALGVDTTKGFMVSVNVNLPSDSGYYGYMASHYVQGSYFLSGTIFKNNAGENKVKNITINPMGRYDEIVSTAS